MPRQKRSCGNVFQYKRPITAAESESCWRCGGNPPSDENTICRFTNIRSSLIPECRGGRAGMRNPSSNYISYTSKKERRGRIVELHPQSWITFGVFYNTVMRRKWRQFCHCQYVLVFRIVRLQAFGISYAAFVLWIARYKEFGEAGLRIRQYANGDFKLSISGTCTRILIFNGNNGKDSVFYSKHAEQMGAYLLWRWIGLYPW